MQPFDWMEAGFRYTDISNRLYDPTGTLNTSQSNKDKGIDVKFRLWPESAYAPEVAVGLRDIAGTGLFSGEYVVANKRTGDFDWSLGLGWGNIGGRGDLRNPLSVFGKSFDTRKGLTAEGGNFGFGSYFRGPTALFGGVQYQTPWEAAILKLEYDGNNYQREPQANNQRQSSPWNFGLSYRAARWADLTVGIERGNTLMFGVTLLTDLPGLQVPKLLDPPRVPVVVGRPRGASDWSASSAELRRQTGWFVERVELRGPDLRVTFADAGAGHWRERVDRAAAVLNRDAPPQVDRFILVYRQRGIDVAEHVIDRDTWVAERASLRPPHEQRAAIVARAPVENIREVPPLFTQRADRFEAGLGFDFQKTIGGPDGFILYQVSAVERAKLRLGDRTWVQGSIRLGLLNNYDKFKYTAPSNLPRVRTFLREYLTTSRLTMPNLQFTHVGKLSDNQYYSVYGGYLEEMFAGVGAEWLYRPFAGRNAFGIDINAVQQRDFRQDFRLRDYRTLTGHGTWYWDTGWNDVVAAISAGRYLAKDYGMTFGVSRIFRNGVSIGAYMTRTNVSAAEFGEGSFDKGIFLSIPFDAIMLRSTSTRASFVWNPLTRDGGAKLGRSDTLYGITGTRDELTLWVEPARPPNDELPPANRRAQWQPAAEGPPPHVHVSARAGANHWRTDRKYEHALVQALYAQRFRNIQVAFDTSYRLSITLANDSIRPVSRAVGRAVRTALRLAPLEAREIHITFFETTHPQVRYEFIDLGRLERYLGGEAARAEFAPTVSVEYLNPAARMQDPLAQLDDLDVIDDSPRLSRLLPDVRPIGRVVDDVTDATHAAANINWLHAGAYGAGMLFAGALVDKRAFTFAKDHADKAWLKSGVRVGNALPWLGMAGAAALALDGSDPRRSRIGYAAMEAGGTAFLAATGLKYAIGRARPDTGLGIREFEFGSTDDRYNAFPSRHSAVAWAVATPFALEYGANWLYGAAALTNLARIGSREHWVSDTIAGGLMGYAIGRLFWESSRPRGKSEPRVLLGPSSLNLAWDLQ